MTEHRRFKGRRIARAITVMAEAQTSIRERLGNDAAYAAIQIMAGIAPDARKEPEEYEKYSREVSGWLEALVTEMGRVFDKTGVAAEDLMGLVPRERE